MLLSCHYDVQPPLDDAAWRTPPFELTERDGRWYGRDAADCKGNIVMHLTALRALGGPEGRGFPVNVKFVAEGSEEQGTGGLEQLVPLRPELFAADALLVCDTGNFALGLPTATTSLRGLANVVVTVSTLRGEMHSGMFGGPAPDALAALVRILDSLRDEHGNTTVKGLPGEGVRDGVDYPAEQFRTDAGVRDGGVPRGHGLGRRRTVGPARRHRPRHRLPAGGGLIGRDPGEGAGQGQPAGAAGDRRGGRPARPDGPSGPGRPVGRPGGGGGGERGTALPGAHRRPRLPDPGAALREAYGKDMVQSGQGGSIPLCNVLAAQFPAAEIVLVGVEEPGCLIHAPNESVDPSEIEDMALAEALFLSSYATPL
ncbi:hypothetical protein GCM10010275_42430 [Streptomyces litmocidini]|nr:hypothetical protein GCM10010275_42430 [Streptomyces litmocidini]